MKRELARALIAGSIGFAASTLVQRLTSPWIVRRRRQPMDVFATERSFSPLGPQHEAGETASEALARRIYIEVFSAEPSAEAKQRTAWALRLAKSCAIASAFAGVCADDARGAVHGGLWLGVALFLVGDELALPLLGLRDKPTTYHPTRHLQLLAEELAFGVATAATLEASR